MTTTPPDAPTDPAGDPAGDPAAAGTEGPRVTRDEVRDLGRLRRSTSDRKVAGVAGGLARHLDVDPLLLRVAFVVLVLFGGAGLLLYGACWLLVPDERTGAATVNLDERSRTVALVGVGVLAALALVGDSWGVFWFPWPVAVVALVALVVLTRRDRREPPPGAGGAPYGPPHDPAVAGGAVATGGGSGPARYRPRDPRRRGPLLFWVTLALAALGVGVLGLVEAAGVDLPTSAYAATVVAATGAMLVLGSVWGRAGGLVLVGLVASVVLAGTTAADNWDGERVRETPATAGEVRDRYRLHTGDLVLDLTEVDDVEELDGRHLEVAGGIGELEVVVPDGLDLQVHASVGGPGAVDFFGEESGGLATDVVRSRDDGDTDLSIDVALGVGQISFREE